MHFYVLWEKHPPSRNARGGVNGHILLVRKGKKIRAEKGNKTRRGIKKCEVLRSVFSDKLLNRKFK